MTRRLVVAVVALVLVSALAYAQTPSKPGPEEQRLGVWVGSWQEERETKAGPRGTPQKSTLTEECEWFTGNFQVVCRPEVTGPKGEKISELEVLAFDHAKNVYTYYAITSNGQSRQATATVSGQTWTFTFIGEGVGPAKPLTVHTTYEVSSTALTAKTQLSQDGGHTWAAVGGITGTKVK